jgi:site-specific DNA-methyltransferase (adenine-specific)
MDKRQGADTVRPYYDEGGITIYHGDCCDVLPYVDPVELVLTDPPYNLGLVYGAHDDKQDPAAYKRWCRQWFGLLPEHQRLVMFPGLSNLPMWCDIVKPTAIGCWYIPGNPGHGFPWSFVEWEPFIYVGGFMGGSNVYRSPVKTQREVGAHPCPKPLSLFRALLGRTKAATILDPFIGSGTTLRAAKDLGMRAIGIEVEERWCEIAARRLGQGVFDFGEAM